MSFHPDQPVFVHSSFRVASTWLWSRFRMLDEALAYYEIFNEQSQSMSVARARRVGPDDWNSGHPAARPYFLEFVPLIRFGRGVADFHRFMAFRRFVPRTGPGGDISPTERAYVARLINHAASRGRHPVLTSTRSLGRVAGLRRAFPGLHLVVYRDLLDQWTSYVEQRRRGNRYFLCSILWTIEGSRHDPLFRQLARRGGLGRADADNTALFSAFVALHAYAYAHAVNAADLVVDVKRLAEDPAHRDDVVATIADRSGLAIDLSDIRDPASGPTHPPPDAEAALAELRPLLEAALRDLEGTPGHDFAMTSLDRLAAGLGSVPEAPARRESILLPG